MDTWEGLRNRPITQNSYLYGYSSPTNGIDPSGHTTLTEVLITAATSRVVQGGLVLGVGLLAVNHYFGRKPETGSLAKINGVLATGPALTELHEIQEFANDLMLYKGYRFNYWEPGKPVYNCAEYAVDDSASLIAKFPNLKYWNISMYRALTTTRDNSGPLNVLVYGESSHSLIKLIPLRGNPSMTYLLDTFEAPLWAFSHGLKLQNNSAELYPISEFITLFPYEE